MVKFEPILTATTFNRIFSITTPLSFCLQSYGLDLLQAWRMVQSAIAKLEMISRANFPTVLHEYLHTVCKESQEKTGFNRCCSRRKPITSKATKVITKRKLPFGEKDDTDNRAMDAYEDFQVNVFNVVMDQNCNKHQ